MSEPISPLHILNPPQETTSHEAPSREEIPFIPRRLTVIVLLFCLVMALFAGRIYQLTILEGPKYRETSEFNFLLQEPIIAPRGRILDSKGRPLAINQTLFDVQMSPFHLKKHEIQATLDRLATLLKRPRIREKTQQILSLRPNWKTISLLDRKLLTLSEVLPVLEQACDLPGIIPVSQYQRYYPAGPLAGSVTGHVGRYTKNQQEDFEAIGYLPDEKVGQQGAEQTFEELLHGVHGQWMVKRDAQGRPRDRYLDRACKPGAILTLSLDMDLQRLADALLGTYHGVVVAMDPRDGSVLAMASHPNYDPNHPMWIRSPQGVTYSPYNKPVNGTYAPGSTFKLVTAAAGLTAGYSPLETIDCYGKYVASGLKIKCTWTHYDENLYEALQHSCNVFFLTWASRMSYDRMIDMSRAFGFGAPTNFELMPPGSEKPGVAGTTGKPYWGDKVQMGMGQGKLISVTPLQLLRSYAAISNGGILYRPRVLKEARLPDGTILEEGHPEEQGRLPLTDLQRGQILEGLRRVVNEEGGTASRYGIKQEWRVCGKTGTAQIGGGKVNAWFVGFAPAENPTIALCILVEKSPAHGGEMCAPLARQLLAYYFGQPEPILYPAGTAPPKPAGAGGNGSTD